MNQNFLGAKNDLLGSQKSEDNVHDVIVTLITRHNNEKDEFRGTLNMSHICRWDSNRGPNMIIPRV